MFKKTNWQFFLKDRKFAKYVLLQGFKGWGKAMDFFMSSRG